MLLKKSFCTENSPDRGREFRVRMWGTSSPDDKLTCDLANVIEAISIDDRGSNCLAAEKLAPGNLGLFQQHRPKAGIRKHSMGLRIDLHVPENRSAKLEDVPDVLAEGRWLDPFSPRHVRHFAESDLLDVASELLPFRFISRAHPVDNELPKDVKAYVKRNKNDAA